MDFSKIGQKVAAFIDSSIQAKKEQVKGGAKIVESIFTNTVKTYKDDIKNIGEGNLKGYIEDRVDNFVNTWKGIGEGAKQIAENTDIARAAKTIANKDN